MIFRPLLRYQHAYRVQQALCVLATAHRLADWVRPQRSDVVLSPNGVDYLHFHNASLSSSPALEPLIASGKPIIGYYGALAAWIDYPLLSRLARMRSDLQFLFIGPSHDHSLEASGLLQMSNVCWVGPVAYADLPGYLRAFDVAMIPFLINSITNATSPIKLFEYMAGGKPVVSTPIAECKEMPGVLIAADAHEFSLQINLA